MAKPEEGVFTDHTTGYQLSILHVAMQTSCGIGIGYLHVNYVSLVKLISRFIELRKGRHTSSVNGKM